MKKGQTYIKDITGYKRGMITVTSYSHSLNSRTHWNCLCDCGNKVILNRKHIVENRKLSCGCWVGENKGRNNFRSFDEAKKYKMDCIMNLSHWENDCLIWDGFCQNRSPKTSFLNVTYAVRRLLWMFAHNFEKPKDHIYTTCKNHKCINIKHLAEGKIYGKYN